MSNETMEAPGTASLAISSSEQHARAIESHPDYRVLRRFVPKDFYHTNPPEKLLYGVIVDTETTGKDTKIDKLIELGMLKFEYCPETGQVYRIVQSFSALEDPGMPISPGASQVNGIFDADVAGKKISDAEVIEMVSDASIVIAHNSNFDRAILENRFKIFEELDWACSFRQVDWQAEGVASGKLEYIAYMLGFFYKAHRAEMDCRATLEVLQRPLPVSGKPALLQLLNNYRLEDKRLWALAANFDKKDTLKGRGYKWGDGTGGTEKAWYTDVPEENREEEIAWLRAEIYSNRQFRLAIDTLGSANRFSARPGHRDMVMC